MIKNDTLAEPNESEPDYKDKLIKWVNKNSTQEIDGCWNWKGSFDRNTNIARYKNSNANTYIYKKLHDCGSVGKVLRSCKNPRCVNPQHSYHTIGAVSRRKLNRELRSAQSTLSKHHESILKDNIESLIKSATSQALHDLFKKEIRKSIKEFFTSESELMRDLPQELADSVVAELLRIKFDEMVAKNIKR